MWKISLAHVGDCTIRTSIAVVETGQGMGFLHGDHHMRSGTFGLNGTVPRQYVGGTFNSAEAQ